MKITLTPRYLDMKDISKVSAKYKHFQNSCTKYMASSVAMTSSTHSFAYSYRWFQKKKKSWQCSKLQSIITFLLFSTDFHHVFTVSFFNVYSFFGNWVKPVPDLLFFAHKCANNHICTNISPTNVQICKQIHQPQMCKHHAYKCANVQFWREHLWLMYFFFFFFYRFAHLWAKCLYKCGCLHICGRNVCTNVGVCTFVGFCTFHGATPRLVCLWRLLSTSL